MGDSRSWLVVRGKAPEAVRAELELRSTGTPGDILSSPFVGAVSDAGWNLIVARGCEHRIISAPVLERLSASCEVFTCTFEEHVMFSEATGWRNGKRLWTVTHKGEDGLMAISADGALPVEYSSIRDRIVAQQEAAGGAGADVDFVIEIPAALVQSLTGYNYDEECPEFEAGGFELLESTRKSFFQRLFSR